MDTPTAGLHAKPLRNSNRVTQGKNIEDPYNWKIGPHGIAAFCMDRVPDRNAWRPNGQWHAFHFVFKDAKWEGDKKVANARATVWWNGIKVHDDAEVKKANGGIKLPPLPAASSFRSMDRAFAIAMFGL